MVSKLVRTGIAGLVLASLVVSGGGLPAQAHMTKPGITPGTEFEIFYYSNAQYNDNIGEYTYGSCGNSFWGTRSSYIKTYEYYCG
jgi:hypothetical protein